MDLPAPQSLPTLIDRYKRDPESVYHTWFVGGEARMKAFRAIRRGVRDTVDAINRGTFGNDFKGSPLEVVLAAVTEQKQVFEGAAHPFYWIPKLRIPDIYEDAANQQAFGRFLEGCINATREEQVLAEISRLERAGIKGLGPAVANIVYFLHPTIVCPWACRLAREEKTARRVPGPKFPWSGGALRQAGYCAWNIRCSAGLLTAAGAALCAIVSVHIH